MDAGIKLALDDETGLEEPGARLRGVVAIGASAGGVTALQHMVRHLDADLPAAVLIVQHIGPHPSILPELLSRAGTIPAAHARDGEVIEAGRIYVAPPDRHMLVEGGVLRLSQAAKEHHTRPAIDPLFRSVALAYGPRAIGVILTGWGDDGTAGLQAIKQCGGRTLVQSPAEADMPEMPMSALVYAPVDATFDIATLGDTLAAALDGADFQDGPKPAPGPLLHEQQIFLGKGHAMEHLSVIGKPTMFVCPDCNGGLWEVHGARPRRFRCHTGHAFTLRSLQEAQAEGTDTALWNAMRGLEEKEMLLRALAEQHLEEGNAEEAARLQVLAHAVAGRATVLRSVIDHEGPADPQTLTA